jgi:PAS domain S-box-containing protein
MILDQDKIEKIRSILKKDPRGLTISDLSAKVQLNRNSLAKYLEILLVSGQVEMNSFGTAKVYRLSQRVPVSALLKFSSELIIMLGSDLEILQVNDHYLTLFGTKREDLIGKKIHEILLPPFTQISIPSLMQEIMEVGDIVKEISFLNGGAECFFKVKCVSTVFDDGGKGITLIIEDITRQKQYERELRIKEYAMASSINGMVIFTPEGFVTYINQSLRNLFGIAKDTDILGKPDSWLAETFGVEAYANIKEGLVQNGHWLGELTATRVDGEPVHVQLSATRARDENGVHLCTLISFVNISELKRVEAEFRKTYEKLQDTIEYMPDATFIVNPEKKVVAWNRAIEALTGVSKESIIGRSDYARAFSFYEGNRPILIDLIDLPARDIARTYPNVRKFGESIFIESYIPGLNQGRGAFIWGKASRLIDKSGNYIGAIESIRDISDWKKAEDSLRQTYERTKYQQPDLFDQNRGENTRDQMNAEGVRDQVVREKE